MILSNKVVCLVGVCGAGMAPLAIYLSERGVIVYGWDDFPDLKIKDLLTKHRIIFLPHKFLPKCCDAIVVSSAINISTDLICVSAKKNNIAVRKRGEFLADLLGDKKLIAIVGSHGKTSVCAGIAEILRRSDIDVDYLVGGFFKDDKFAPSKYCVDSDWVVAEVDESDCTIEHFIPEVTVALNYDDDHIANYQGDDGLKAAFKRLFNRTKSKIYVSDDDPVFLSLVGDFEEKVVKLNDLSVDDFTLRNKKISLTVSGDVFGASFNENLPLVGVKRRNDFLCVVKNVTFIHDYAHHPTEIEAVLKYMRSRYYDHEVTVVFQPHRVSRTRQYYREFAEVLQHFDSVILVDIYRAFEEQFETISGSMIYDLIGSVPKIFVSKLDDLNGVLWRYCSSLKDDKKHVVLFVCAGDLIKCAKSFADEWRICALCRELMGYKFSESEPIGNKTTFGNLAIARLIVEPRNESELIFLLKLCKKYNSRYIVVGNGSKLIFPDGVFHRVIIRLSEEYWSRVEHLDDVNCRAYSGVKLSNLNSEAEKFGFNGYSFLSRIPATVGGAVYMNAGAHGHSISELVSRVCVMREDGSITVIELDDCGFKYRGSSIDPSCIILYAEFVFKNFDDLDLVFPEKFRMETQPYGRTFGSMFKNPNGDCAGRLIDLASLKGYRCGDAMISDKHANFLVNVGKASSNDVENLIDLARYEVFSKFSIFLENEVLLLRK